jgi:hypothetical protein
VTALTTEATEILLQAVGVEGAEQGDVLVSEYSEGLQDEIQANALDEETRQ